MNLELQLNEAVNKALSALYNDTSITNHSFQKTRKEFDGDVTLVSFAYIKISKKSPEITGEEIGNYLKTNCDLVSDFNVVKGFLNLVIDLSYWSNFFNINFSNAHLGFKTANASSKTVMVEFSSPNTNKPLHLGHTRNILLGISVSNILEAAGNKVIKVNLVNDRGVHICKSMLAYQRFGNNELPASLGGELKGDHLIGKYYVAYDKAFKQEVADLIASGMPKEEAEKKSALAQEVSEMLRKWEAGDPEIMALWKKLNDWVYEGFAVTYKELGATFDKIYYESEMYLLGKDIVNEGLQKNVFFKKPDGSTWIDLTADKLDEKVVLRADGTSVYITQDIGTAVERAKEFNIDSLVYVVGNEQDYHFKVLFKTLEKLDYAWAKNLFHLSYGMIELPEGKMKSREGTVVDADEMIFEMKDTARSTTEELGKVEDFNDEEKQELFHTLGMGALKYFILKVDPKKKMLFNPKESIDFNGHTGPFIQYTHARIKSILRKAASENISYNSPVNYSFNDKEKELIKYLFDFEKTIAESAHNYSPALVANYVYELTKSYNQFYHDYSIFKEENAVAKIFRIQLSLAVANVIKSAMNLLGIEVPEKM